MKKSTIYRLAQIAVLRGDLPVCDKLTILRELMDKEDVALFCEKREEMENAEKEQTDEGLL